MTNAFATDRDTLLQRIKQIRQGLIDRLRAAQARGDWATETRCRELLAAIEHNPDIAAEFGENWLDD